MRCPTPIDLQSYFDGELNKRKMRQIAAHLEKCENCRNQLEDLARLVLRFQDGLTMVDVPKVNPNSVHPSGKTRRLLAAAAIIIILIGIPAFWYFGRIQPNHNGQSRETELMEEYMILHLEEDHSAGGSNV